ncbi:hypothetical protein SAMN05443144_11812 [Fodinibius roseus]|uniref:Uncharacterized protein n=1 Tax=Fodinibius roseus TaxID=1194090 RepID=A0A1M5GRQ6_9BACT|nr:hypothetical protein SAMN05443144_11812 [Fodinibius roseus]
MSEGYREGMCLLYLMRRGCDAALCIRTTDTHFAPKTCYMVEGFFYPALFTPSHNILHRVFINHQFWSISKPEGMQNGSILTRPRCTASPENHYQPGEIENPT